MILNCWSSTSCMNCRCACVKFGSVDAGMTNQCDDCGRLTNNWKAVNTFCVRRSDWLRNANENSAFHTANHSRISLLQCPTQCMWGYTLIHSRWCTYAHGHYNIVLCTWVCVWVWLGVWVGVDVGVGVGVTSNALRSVRTGIIADCGR